MRLPSYAKALRLAERLTVLDQRSGTFQPFVLNEEQREVLRAILEHPQTIVGKPRQTGATTVCVYALTLVAIMNDGLPCAIVADRNENAESAISKAKHWLSELGAPLEKSNVMHVVLANGASLKAMTARTSTESGDSLTGRGRSFGVIHATEHALWSHAQAVWASLTSAKLADSRLIIESTGQPGETLFRSLYEDAPGWHRVFLGVEQHSTYRADPDLLDEAAWARLREEFGFTSRESAAWWWRHLQEVLAGDVHRMRREYPVRPSDMFTFAVGRHIRDHVEAAVREDGPWNHYDDEDDGSGLVMGVDVAKGVGADASAIALLRRSSGRLVATYRSATIDVPAFSRLVVETARARRPSAVVVESNGIGASVYQDAYNASLPVFEQKSAEGELWDRRGKLRQAVELGELPIGGHLLHEVEGSVISPKGRFEGPDDVLSAISFARRWMEEHPWRSPAPPPPDRRNVFDPTRYLKGRRKGRGL